MANFYGMEAFPKICETIGVTSAIGGSGATSAAIALCRVYSSLFEYKTLFLSLDYLSAKARPNVPLIQNGIQLKGRDVLYGLLFEEQIACGKLLRDEFGVYYFPPDSLKNSLHFLVEEQFRKLLNELSREFDRIVIDIPINSILSGYALETCDSVVLCAGWQEDRFDVCEEFFNHLKEERDGIFSFAPMYDEERGADLYGNFGKEVRNLAETIEGR